MQRVLARLSNWRLLHILIVGFAFTAAITIVFGSVMTYRVINNYLEDAQDARVGRDMDLAEAFYNNKQHDIASTAARIASTRSVRHNLSRAGAGDTEAIGAIDEAIETEISNLPANTQRFIVVTDERGKTVAGLVASGQTFGNVLSSAEWSALPIVERVLTQHRSQSALTLHPRYIPRFHHVGQASERSHQQWAYARYTEAHPLS